MPPERRSRPARPSVAKVRDPNAVPVLDEFGVEIDQPPAELVEKVVFVNRCAKVVKGGRRFHFSALVVCGDRRGRVGYGFGKANEVADAIRKGTDLAKRAMVRIKMKGSTIPHEMLGVFGGGVVLLRPASPGTGVIAGGSVRAVLEAAGVRDVLTKSLGSSNAVNVVKATMDALLHMRPKEEIFRMRGLSRPAAAAVVS